MRTFALASSLLLTLHVTIASAQNVALTPPEATRQMKVPQGFHVSLFAGEPDVVQPIAMTFDARGRLWVVECFSYPDKFKDQDDRVVVFTDQDHDGRFDKRTLFWQGGTNVTGIEVGFGGVWLTATPNLLFIADRDGDDRPDAEPQVVLDGWDLKARHNKVNGLIWGPDGWLYGCNGILSNSLIGPPGTPEEKRTPINCGVWRWHPTKHVFEVVATGTTNPWGLDFDQHGEMFITNCVINHLWHVTPGSHFQRMFGQDFNPHNYQLMESCADHIHWAGGPWQESRGNQAKHSQQGGGHAHSGAMIYLGDNWPDAYRNTIFMCNIHGMRLNQDVLEPHDSSYVARHGQDFLAAGDPWYRGIALKQGPDGAMYLADWTDTGECHNYMECDRSNGRIFRVSYGDGKNNAERVDAFAKLDDVGLYRVEFDRNHWFGRQARRLLQEQAVAKKLSPELNALLQKEADQLCDAKQSRPREHSLFMLWTLHVVGQLTPERTLKLLNHSDALVRAWTIPLALEDRQPSAELLSRLAKMATSDPSPVVRRRLASGLQRLEPAQRWDIAQALTARSEDASDTNLSLLMWYGTEPLVAADTTRATMLVPGVKIPLVRQYLVRRIGSVASGDETLPALKPLVEMLAGEDQPGMRHDILRGLLDAFTGRREVAMPPAWPAVYRRLAAGGVEIKQLATALSLVFGDPQALASLRKDVQDTQLTVEERKAALAALLQKKDTALVEIMHSLVASRDLRSEALLGLAQYDSSATPTVVLAQYANLDDAQRRQAVATLCSRPSYAMALLNAIAAGKIPTSDLSAFDVRQLSGFKDRQVDEMLAKTWGEVRPTDKDKKARIKELKTTLTKQLKQANLSHGRTVFTKTCASCHKLFEAGTKIGPDLTGSQRANLDYVLENLVDPNAVIGRDFQMTLVQTEDGRVLNGIIVLENDNAITLQTPNDKVIVPKNEIEVRQRSPLSMMPAELLEKISPTDLRDLVGYLASPQQVEGEK